MTGDEIDDVVDWQMSNIPHRKRPARIGLCPGCFRDWHGLPSDGCDGPFDTPNAPKE